MRFGGMGSSYLLTNSGLQSSASSLNSGKSNGITESTYVSRSVPDGRLTTESWVRQSSSTLVGFLGVGSIALGGCFNWVAFRLGRIVADITPSASGSSTASARNKLQIIKQVSS